MMMMMRYFYLISVLLFSSFLGTADSVEGVNWAYTSPHLIGLDIGSLGQKSPIQIASLVSIPSGKRCNVIVASTLHPAATRTVAWKGKSKIILSLKSLNTFDGKTRWSTAIPIQVYNSSQHITSTVQWESIIHVPVHETEDLINVATPYTSEFFSGIVLTLSREIEGTGILTYKLRAWNADSGSLSWEKTLWQTVDIEFNASKGSIMLLDLIKKDQLSVPQLTVLVSVSGLLFRITTKMDSVLTVASAFATNTQTDFLFSRFVTDTLLAGTDSKYKVVGSGCYGDSQICRSTIGVVLSFSDELIIHDVELPSDLPVAIHANYLQFVNTKLSPQGVSGLNSMKILALGCSADGSTSCRLLVIAFTFRKETGVSSSSVGTVVSSLAIPQLFSVSNVELSAVSGKQFRVCYSVDLAERCDDVLVGNDGQVVFAQKLLPNSFERVLQPQPDIVCVAKTSKAVSQGVGSTTPRLTTSLHCGVDVDSARDAPSDLTYSVPLIQSTFSADPYSHLSLIKTKSAYRLFGTTVSGLVFTLQISSLLPQPVFDSVLWEKDEWPGHMAQALILDSKQQLSAQQQDSAAVISKPQSFADVVQQLSIRLALQKQDLVDFALEFADSVSSLFDKFVELSTDLQSTVDCNLLGSTSPACRDIDVARVKAKLTKGDISKRKQFGFEKYSVVLSHSSALSRHLSRLTEKALGPAPPAVSFTSAVLQINAMKLLVDSTEEVARGVANVNTMWKVVPKLPESVSATADPVVSFVKLLSSHTGAEVNVASARSSALFVSTVDSGSFIWNIDGGAYNAASEKTKKTTTMGKSKEATRVCAAVGDQSVCRSEVALYSTKKMFELSPTVHVKVKAPVKAIFQLSGDVLLMMHDAAADGNSSTDTIQLTRFHSGSAPLPSTGDQYIHFTDKIAGQLQIYQVTNTSCGEVECVCVGHCQCDCVVGKPVASVSFSSPAETLLEVVYPNPHKIISKSSVLGDDSVLLKYLNPNMVAVTTAIHSATSTDRSDVVAVAVTLVDVVSGRIIKKLLHEGATVPVHCLIVENFVITTYWNSQFKRTELSSTALYDGAIDKYELSPFAGFMSSSGGGGGGGAGGGPRKSAKSYPTHMSSFSDGISPLTVQKTFILPRPVSALQSTITERGITNKHIIVSQSNGQIYDLDLLQVHPRRPVTEPTLAEKEEGLMRYSPYVVLGPLSALTRNYSVGWEAGEGGLDQILTSPVRLESSALVFSFSSRGDGLAGCHLAAVMPSQGFDQLAPDFNHGLLVLILVGLAAIVVAMRKMYSTKRLNAMWA